jgi:hypothetical protein
MLWQAHGKLWIYTELDCHTVGSVINIVVERCSPGPGHHIGLLVNYNISYLWFAFRSYVKVYPIKLCGGVAAATPPNQPRRCILTDYFSDYNCSKLK